MGKAKLFPPFKEHEVTETAECYINETTCYRTISFFNYFISFPLLLLPFDDRESFKPSYKKYEKLTGIESTTAVLRALDVRF